MTLEQERAFLQPFFARAETGEIATAEHIQQAEDRRSEASRAHQHDLSPPGSSRLAQAGAPSAPPQGQPRRASHL